VEQRSGFLIAYEVRQTAEKGRGIFAREAVSKGHLVWRFEPGCYEIYDETTFRAALAGMSQAEAVYELTHVFGDKHMPGHLIKVLDEGVLINHDETPNVAVNHQSGGAVFPVDADIEVIQAALLEPRFALVATRDIAPGEEITHDYRVEVFDPAYYSALCDAYRVEEDYL